MDLLRYSGTCVKKVIRMNEYDIKYLYDIYYTLVTELDIETTIPNSCDCTVSNYCYQPAGHIFTGNLILKLIFVILEIVVSLTIVINLVAIYSLRT